MIIPAYTFSLSFLVGLGAISAKTEGAPSGCGACPILRKINAKAPRNYQSEHRIMDRYTLPANCALPLPDLQAEHEGLIDILNWGLDTIATASEPSTELFLSLLEDLRRLLNVHFAHEERVMTRCRFPHLPPHAQHHDLCLARLERLGELLLEGRLRANKFLLDELYDMLLDDVVRADGEFKTFLEKGDVSIRTQSRGPSN